MRQQEVGKRLWGTAWDPQKTEGNRVFAQGRTGAVAARAKPPVPSRDLPRSSGLPSGGGEGPATLVPRYCPPTMR